MLASAGHILYRNDDTPLSVKLTRMVELLVRQINLLDLLAVAGLGALTVLASTALAAGGYLLGRRRPRRTRTVAEAMKVVAAEAVARRDEDRRVSPSSPSEAGPHIHVLLKSTQPRQCAEVVRRLPHICPTGVFEVPGRPLDTVEVTVHGEKCIHCEACWRTNPLVDWARAAVLRAYDRPYSRPW